MMTSLLRHRGYLGKLAAASFLATGSFAYAEEQKPVPTGSQSHNAHIPSHLSSDEQGIGERFRSHLHLPVMPWAHHVSSEEEYEKQKALPVERAVLTTAPNVPPPIKRRHPALVKVDLTTELKTIQIDSRYKYEAWTFNGSVPGPMIRARVGDIVELSLTNLDASGNPHNIDCHGFEGPGGGAALTLAQENETKVARFKLLYPGLFVYHCAAAPVPVHIANGMYGLMLIEPENPTLPPVEKEYFVMQSEYYFEPPERLSNGRLSNTVEFSYPRGLQEDADLVVFNGREGAATRDAPLKAQTGDRVRIYFGNAGPNLTSSFHAIGGIFEKTVSVPPGGCSILDMHMLVPGTYALVDHAIFRLDKGAVGFLNVSGAPRPDLYHSEQPPQQCTGCKLHN
eukprot:scaffold6599_cov166-Ochromonas_danica.AAC.6